MGPFRKFVYWFLLITVFCLLNRALCESTYYDAVVTEATSDPSSELNHRQAKQATAFLPTKEQILAAYNEDIGNSPLLTGPCFTSKGSLGRCMSFRQCYPFFKLPDLNNWDSWILGMYDTCTYFTIQGRQMFGVCCTNPMTTTTPPEATSTTVSPNFENNATSKPITDAVKRPNYEPAVWPPPFITHPPDHTIPPLPTHAPTTGFPAYPTHPPAYPTHPPAYPTHPPAYPTHPPAYPTHPPAYPTPSKPPAYPTPAIPVYPPTKPPAPIPAVPISDHSCGAKNGYQDQERIVGGHNADLGEWPWIAALFNGGRQFCGGSLIDEIHILSAAHCVAHMSSWDVARLTVRLGDYNIRTNSEVQHIEKKVKRVVRHRGFDSRTLYNDVAILTLDSPVQYSQQIRPICLPSGHGDYVGKTATVIGWGSIREMGPQPAVLQEVNIPIWSNSDCRSKYGGAAPGGIVEHMLCAGQASRDSCSGDSGGPLMVNTGRWIQVGIVSWGIGCGKGQYPGVYTRVDTFLSWIQKNMKE